MASVSGLSVEHRIEARDLAMQAAYLGLRRKASLHYTQGSRRWEGINRRMKAWRGECPQYADCSSFATWCLWNGLSHFKVRDTVNGLNWKAGFTGTMAQRGKLVRNHANIMRGDLVLYGDPMGRSGHVAIAVGGRRVISFGSEAGPFLLNMYYRPVTMVRRYI